MNKGWKAILDVWQGPENVSAIYFCSNFINNFGQVFPKSKPLSIHIHKLRADQYFFILYPLVTTWKFQWSTKKIPEIKENFASEKTKMLKILKIEYKQKGVKLNCLLLKQEKELTSPIFCHFIQQNLNISRAITAENSPLHIGRNRTQTMNFWFPSTSR